MFDVKKLQTTVFKFTSVDNNHE